jgi:hypothetical protein
MLAAIGLSHLDFVHMCYFAYVVWRFVGRWLGTRVQGMGEYPL